jgi:5-methylcytosine-specific restriction endonuclease McrA
MEAIATPPKSKPRSGGDKRGSSADRRARRFALLARHGDGRTCPCSWCGRTLTENSIEADRIDEGGSYRRSNVIPACRQCNAKRSDTPAAVFVERCKTPTAALRAIALARG